MKKLGFLLKKTRGFIGFKVEKANVYYYGIGVGIAKDYYYSQEYFLVRHSRFEEL